MWSRRCRIVLLVLAAAVAMTAGTVARGQESPPERAVLVVFEFEFEPADSPLGKNVAAMFRGHAQRRGRFIQLDPITFEEILGESGATVTMESDSIAVGRLAERHFGAQIAIWGKVTRLAADSYELHVRVMDRRKDRFNLALDETFRSTLHGLMISVEETLDMLVGKERLPERDILQDESWKTRKNLCKNGDFEAGHVTPEAWERMDGLCTFRVEDELRGGKCLMIFTDVPDDQYVEWRRRWSRGAPASAAPKPLPTHPPKYDTVGGIHGAHVYSDPIPILPGRTYRIDFDHRGTGGNTKCFVKGYAPFMDGRTGKMDSREVYRLQMNIKLKRGGGEWEHFAGVMHPTQPLLLLTFRSDFDGGKTGARLRKMLAERFASAGVIEFRDADDVLRRIKGKEDLLGAHQPKYDVAQVVNLTLGLGVCVWGEVKREGGRLKVFMRSLDVRPGGSTTKDLWFPGPKEYLDTTPDRLHEVANKLVAAALENARIVTHLRVKLDAYWPPGKFYFDNVVVTQEALQE